MRLSKRVTIQGSTAGAFGNSAIVLHWHVPESEASAIQLIGLLNYEIDAPGAESIIVQLSVLGVSGTGDVVSQSVTLWDRPSEDFQRHVWHLLDTPLVDGYWVTLFVTAGMGSDGGEVLLTAGGLWAGPVWTLPDGINAAWSQTIIDPGTMARSTGGQGYPRRRQRYRSFDGSAIDVPFANAFGDPTEPSLLDIQQLLYRIGKTEPVALLPRTLDATGVQSSHVIHRLGIYGHMAETGRLEHAGEDYYRWTGVRVDELG